ncbi:MAG TPA: thioester reductase domain-containing protein [Streptosporangiaceae bacterium]
MSDTAIAIIGIGCRFPDARTPEEFWANVDGGVVSMRPLPEDVLRAAGVSERTLRGDDYVRVGTRLPGVAEFAGEFFGYTPREAELIDPQHRIFLETSWEALERAGHIGDTDRHTIGVFAGTGAGTYATALLAAKARDEGVAAAVGDLDLTLGGEVDFLPSKTAYKLGLRGPAMSVQTGCSSSLYALHYAALSLLAGECDIALAGGSAVQEPVLGYRHTPGGALSVDGQCRSFDHRSTGTVHGSGVGVVVLRLLDEALADGDTVLAVLHGSAVGNDGADKLGYVAPSPAGIGRVVRRALQVSGIAGARLRYLEAHGTATPLGDEVELAALTDAVGETSTETGFCRLGSVMSNIGHTGPTAGIAGVIKAVHIARTGTLPPHPSFERARDEELLAASPFTVATDLRRCQDECFVLVNSVGMGGSNAAAVLGPPPAPTRPPAPRGERVRLLVSARTRVELDALCRDLADHLDRAEVDVAGVAADVAYTLRTGRRQFAERRMVTAEPHRLAAALRLPRPPLAITRRGTERRPVVVHPAGVELPAELARPLRAALPAGTPWVADVAEAPADRFVLRIPDAADPRDALEAALAEAWLHGVAVDWAALSPGAGRRVPLPTYPFSRRRYWALDRVSLSAGGGAATAPVTAPVTEVVEDDVEAALLRIWRELFDADTIGLDDRFGALGGTSLLAMQLALAIQDRFDCAVNVHRAGGSQVTVRRLAERVRAQRAAPGGPAPQPVVMDDGLDQGDDELVDADLGLSLGTAASGRSRGRDFLLTGATGYLGAFLLHELLARTKRRIYCLVRAEDEAAGLARLRAAAGKFRLPDPDPERVHIVPGDLRNFAKVANLYRDGELAGRVGHILHCAAKVVFTEPYRTLRADNVLPMADLLAWARESGIRDFSYVSTVAATGPAMGSGARYLETREQPLDPLAGSYGASKWVCERLLARAEQDGMRVRVFRPGLVMASSRTGAGNDKDLIYFVLVSGLAVGAHPVDDRALVMAPVDVVAQAVVDLALAPGSVGRAYHLVAERGISLRGLFGLLAEVGLPTEPLPLPEWQDRVRALALARNNPVLSAAALIELEGHDTDELAVQAGGWQPWLARNGLDPKITGARLRRGIEYLAGRDQLVRDLVGHLVDAGRDEADRTDTGGENTR